MANEQLGSMNLSEKRDFFGHPRGLSTLFFTEFWERFSYYGMRALLVLFMTAEAVGSNPGMGFDVGRATAIYGLYTFFVYVLSLPGGWIADNLWGQRKAVFVGGCIIAAGHFSMAVPTTTFFFIGLALIVIGTGLLKPNVSSMVGDLYPEGGASRDAGFSIFYMGINFGAILGPLLCGLLGEGYSWHYGFSLAGIGMILGLITYKIGGKFLGDAGDLKTGESAEVINKRSKKFYGVLSVVTVFIVLFGFLVSSGFISLSLAQIAQFLGTSVALLALIYFAYLINGAKSILTVLLVAGGAFFVASFWYDYTNFAYIIGILATVVCFLVYNSIQMLGSGSKVSRTKKRLFVIFWLFILAALFWSGFEQAGSSLNLFTKDLVDRSFGPSGFLASWGSIGLTLAIAIPVMYAVSRVFKRDNIWSVAKWVVAVSSVGVLVFLYWVFQNIGFGWTTPASTLQLINPTFIVILAPIFGWMWTWLAARNANPSIPVKFGLGLFGLAAGFFVLSWGAANASPTAPVSVSWLVVTYFLHTCGELALSPVGLSSMTKLAPKNRVSQMMGIWFVAAALGNLFAGLVAGSLETQAPSSLFWTVALIIGGGGIVALLASPFVRKLMGDVE